jgi:uncharacterized protein (DUF2141 family)
MGSIFMFTLITGALKLPLFLFVGVPLVMALQTNAPNKGQWMVSVRDAQGVPLKELVIPANLKDGKQYVNLGNWEPGTYTLAVYLDVNKNNKLDKGILGQPLEPYAFSNNARSAFSAPGVEEQAFQHPKEKQVLRVKL